MCLFFSDKTYILPLLTMFKQNKKTMEIFNRNQRREERKT